jgi:isopenicillin-N epimerase
MNVERALGVLTILAAEACVRTSASAPEPRTVKMASLAALRCALERLVTMSMNRRGFLSAVAATATSAVALPAARAASDPGAPVQVGADTPWDAVRSLFELRTDRIHMSGLLFASHPQPVRDAIAKHREELQRDPASYISHERWRLEGEVLKSASAYLGVSPVEIALTDSTSMGLALLYSGLKLKPRDEVLTTNHDHYACEAALLVCAERTGCAVKRINLYRDVSKTTADEIVDAVRHGISAATRVVAMTWVHSGTGLKIPVRAIADAIAAANRERGSGRRITCALTVCTASA